MRASMTLPATAVGLALALVAPHATAQTDAPVPPVASVVAPPPAAPVIEVATGRGRLVTLSRPMSDLFIADDSVADVQVRSPTQLYVFGKKTGETTISATSKAGAVVFGATVRVGNNLGSVGQMLALAMPEAKITATPMNGIVLLTGTVAAPADAAEAERLTQAFVGDSTRVLSRLRTATPLQVSLQVRIAEVSRSFIKNVGVNFGSVDATGGFKFGLTRGRGGGSTFTPGGPLGVGFTTGPAGGSLVTQNSNGTSAGLAGRLLGLDLLAAIDLGETIGQVTTLANPNLTALSGETSTFLVGGEIPILVSQGLGAVSVQYKDYGVALSYTPTVLADGRINLHVRPSVSQLSSAGSIQTNGTTIPALSTRRAETTVELGSGQSLVIGGLMSNNHQNSIDKTPFLGDLPILGALFRSNNFRRDETELVIVVTPYLVHPVDSPSQVALPTDGYKAPNDAERILLGKQSGGETGGTRPVPRMAAPSAASPVSPPAPAGAGGAPMLRSSKPGVATPGFSN
ncbi:hypothetical protein GCM10011380_02260 [Sphingomonas metalli]|uniref:Secretion system protein n=1 Tax=Sphingomonas metalli TaxID=1779358 RepID=A0A916STH8_9SPHN|nr:type II and III secretion system protein family protein [Sphingomonas metalli]GGB16312.1 hypothetical protein GCM10011380_02260 [Sphingomonas metalli]